MRKLLNGSNIYIMTQLISNIDKEKLDVTVKVPHYDDICTKAFTSEPVIQVQNINNVVHAYIEYLQCKRIK